MSSDLERLPLRLMTYLSPGLPLGLFQTYQCYLEEVLGCDVQLVVESRWNAPPAEKVDPFTSNQADLVFMCSTGYLRLLDGHNQFMELLPVAPVFDNPKADNKPVYFSDVIIRSEKAPKFKEFADLRGHRWAVNDNISMSGNVAMLTELKQLGVNASFFGHIVRSESQRESVSLVLNNAIDAAAVDSHVFSSWLDDHPNQQQELHVLCSWGPWPAQPIVVNSRLSAETKQKITEALLKVTDHSVYGERFQKYHVTGFKPINESTYDGVRQAIEQSKNEKVFPAYY